MPIIYPVSKIRLLFYEKPTLNTPWVYLSSCSVLLLLLTFWGRISVKTVIIEQSMVAHTFNPRTPEAEVEMDPPSTRPAWSTYISSSRPARAT